MWWKHLQCPAFCHKHSSSLAVLCECHSLQLLLHFLQLALRFFKLSSLKYWNSLSTAGSSNSCLSWITAGSEDCQAECIARLSSIPSKFFPDNWSCKEAISLFWSSASSWQTKPSQHVTVVADTTHLLHLTKMIHQRLTPPVFALCQYSHICMLFPHSLLDGDSWVYRA